MLPPQRAQQACRALWLKHLTHLALAELDAPPGGRAYLWWWVTPHWDKALGVAVSSDEGFVDVRIDPGGQARLRSVWSKGVSTLPASDLAAFEAALAKTSFSILKRDELIVCADNCPYHLMEAVVDGRYHYVERDGGISEPGIRDAGVLLEQIARHAARSH